MREEGGRERAHRGRREEKAGGCIVGREWKSRGAHRGSGKGHYGSILVTE